MAITKIVKGPINITNGRFNNACYGGWKVNMTIRLNGNKQTTLQNNYYNTNNGWKVEYTGSAIVISFTYSGATSTCACNYTIAPNTWYQLEISGDFKGADAQNNATIKIRQHGHTTWTTVTKRIYQASSIKYDRTLTLGDANVEFAERIFLQGSFTGYSSTGTLTIDIENNTWSKTQSSGSLNNSVPSFTVTALSQILSSNVSSINITDNDQTLAWEFGIDGTAAAYYYRLVYSVNNVTRTESTLEWKGELKSGTIAVNKSNWLYTTFISSSVTGTLTLTTYADEDRSQKIGVSSSVNCNIKLGETLGASTLAITSNFNVCPDKDNYNYLTSSDRSYVAANGKNYRGFSVTLDKWPTIPDSAQYDISVKCTYPVTITTTERHKRIGRITLQNISIAKDELVDVEVVITSPRTKKIYTFVIDAANTKGAFTLHPYSKPIWVEKTTFSYDGTNINWTPSKAFNQLATVPAKNYANAGATIINALNTTATINGVNAGAANQTSFAVGANVSEPIIFEYSFTDKLGEALGCPAAIVGREAFVTTINGIVARRDSKGVSFGGPVGDPDKVMFYWKPYLVDGEKISPIIAVKPISIAGINSLFNK